MIKRQFLLMVILSGARNLLLPSDALHAIKLSLKKPTRCDPNGKSDQNGKYFKVELTGKRKD